MKPYAKWYTCKTDPPLESFAKPYFHFIPEIEDSLGLCPGEHYQSYKLVTDGIYITERTATKHLNLVNFGVAAGTTEAR